MSHIQQQEYCNMVREKLPAYFKNKIVIDIGCLDINGSNADLFDECLYIGIDVGEGRNVDFVVKGHELNLPSESVDTIISTECFEHDIYYQQTIANIYRMLKPGGLFVFTCATTGRPEHGTLRTKPEDAPLLSDAGWSDYYKNLTESDIRNILAIEECFSSFAFEVKAETRDLYFWGIKVGEYRQRDDYSFLIRNKWRILKEENAKLVQVIQGRDQELQQKNEELQQKNEDLQQKDEKLQQKNQDLQHYENLAHALLHSYSWRITKPLRTIKNILTKIIKLLLWPMIKLKIWNGYLQKFIFSRNKSVILKQIYSTIKEKGLLRGLTCYFAEKNYEFSEDLSSVLLSAKRQMVILTTPHCLFIAHLISNHLTRIGIDVAVIFAEQKSGFSNLLHIVITPQAFDKLPPYYVAFQMEQSTNARWFNDRYFNILERSIAIVDYSLKNIEWLLNNKVGFRQLYYLPVHYFREYRQYLNLADETEIYDIVFYGDINSSRRKRFIDAISKRYKLKILNEVFGSALTNELNKAKLVLNIHYYENALLETTRLYECLSLGKLVISEKSYDQNEYVFLNDIIEFTDIDDVEMMMSKIDFWLQHDQLRQEKVIANKVKLEHVPNDFTYFFYRFLLAWDILGYDKFYSMVRDSIIFNNDFLCLTLPECPARHMSFSKDNQYKISVFNGIKHNYGWVGCGLSFKVMINKAMDLGMEYIIICEDDVDFPPDFGCRLRIILQYLQCNESAWDIFSGLIADLKPETQIIDVEGYQGEEFIYIDKMTSTVFNIYHKNIFQTIVNWDHTKRDATTNTIDRYLEKGGLRIITTTDFLVGHKEEEYSTLWNFKNDTYRDWIARSSKLLKQKINDWKSNQKS